jgi:type IV pilus assembly protein PilX
MKALPRNQRGIVLVVSLIMLLLLTVLAISASTTATLQERMAFNAQENNVAFQTAESGLTAVDVAAMKTCSADNSEFIQPVTYVSGRTTRALVIVEYELVDGNELGVEAPTEGRYDISSNATLDDSATTASTIKNNSNALHRQGYRCRGLN